MTVQLIYKGTDINIIPALGISLSVILKKSHVISKSKFLVAKKKLIKAERLVLEQDVVGVGFLKSIYQCIKKYLFVDLWL